MEDTDVKVNVESQEKVSNGMMNGISNGSSSHKHKHKDKDRDREKDRHKSSHKDKDKDRHSSHKSSHKDKDRDRHKEHRDKDKKSSHKSKDRDRDKDRDHKHSSDKDRHKSDKHRDEKHKDSSDKDRHKSDKHSSDRDKHRSSEKDRHKNDRHDKHKKSSDRDKDRHHSHKSSHKDKDRDKDREKNRDKDRERSKDKQKEVEPKVEVKEEPEFTAYEEPIQNNNVQESSDEFRDEDNAKVVKEEYLESEEENQLVIKEENSNQTDEDSQVNSASNIYTEESEDEDDVPLKARKKIKKEDSDDDFTPVASSKRKIKKESDDDEDFTPTPKSKKKVKKEVDDEEDFKPAASKKRVKPEESDDDDDIPLVARKKIKLEKSKTTPKSSTKKRKSKAEVKSDESVSPKKKKKKEEEEENVWKWWEEERRDDGRKWKYLEHKGPVFADPYEPLPSNVKFFYNGKQVKLSEPAEEVAGFYGRMLDHDYTTKEVFNKNFFKDWRKTMNSEERALITDLSKCDFKQMLVYFKEKSEERKNRTKEEKKELRLKNEAIVKEYGWCVIDNHKQRIGNFKIEPPGLFRGRGDHPKQGMVKRRVNPEDVIINCSRDSKIPEPPPGRKWKEVRHDNTVTWLANWTENVQNQGKYVMLNAASKLKGEKDWQKYETARKLHKIVDKIRENYLADFKSKEMRVRQRAVALYFIDKLALRAGNEKDEDQADTVGCCSLRVEHIKLFEEKDGKEFVVVFDFLGKDSIRYYNEVPVEKRVFKNLTLFMENKQEGDDLFDRLNTQIMNKHLNELMEGLTAKVFRTYNASRTLQEQLERLTDPDDPIPQKILSYNRANREVAILCNHQRAVPKTFDKSMANLQKKIDDKRDLLEDEMRQLKDLKKMAKQGGTAKDKTAYDKKKKAVERIEDQLKKLEISATDKEENKQIALGTSKLNYLDPRISVAWCKKYDVPIEKIYNKTQRQKFQWAIDMATADYNFMGEPMNVTRNSQSENDDEDEEEEEDM